MLTDEYVKRVYAQVEKRDGDQPEFLQAVREVFESLQPVVEKHPEYEKAGVLERLVEPERVVSSVSLGRTMRARCRSTAVTASSSTPRSDRTRAACASTRP